MRKILTSALMILVPANLPAQTSPIPSSDAPASAEARKDYAQISIEELLNRDVAVAATKTRVDVAKAPVSVTVLTPEDIRRSGAANLGDLLRTVPGLDVLESFPGHISVSARGTSEVFVNNMLVLIDGRRLEFQVAGVPFFENAPVRLDDIKRIEVVKGPVGALYGTNALSGIISITTYSADEVPGTLVSVTGGNRDTYGSTLRQAGRIGRSGWAYKLLGGYTYTSTWASLERTDKGPSVAIRKGDLVAALSRRFDHDARLDFEAGLTKGDLASLTVVTTQTRFFTWPHFRAAYSRPDFHAQLAFSPQSSELRERTGPVQPLNDAARALNLSVDRTLRPFSSSTLTAGGNVRYQRSTFTNIGSPHSQVVGAVFLQDEQVVVPDRVSVFGAVGVSHHPEIPTQVDGNAAFVVTPVEGHSLRLSFGRGHRDPSFNENFFNFRRRFGSRDGYQTSNRDLDPESIVAWEAGYHGRFARGQSTIRVFVDGFREEIHDLIATKNTIVKPGTLPQYPTVTIIQRFENLEDREGYGFETGIDWERSAIRLASHYAYQSFENAQTGAEIAKDVPRHKFSAGLHLRRGALDLGAWVHTVSKTLEDRGYVLVNPRLGLRHGQWLLSLQSFNALNDRHVETANPTLKGESVGRIVTLTLARTLGGQ